MTNDFLQKSLYEILYNNLLLLRTHEIDHEEEREVFDGTTESLIRLYRDNQITFEQFVRLSETDIKEIIAKSKDLPISKERFFALTE